MSDLQDKLRRAFRVRPAAADGGPPGLVPSPSTPPHVRELLQRRLERTRQRVTLPEGVEERNDHGAFFVRRLRYPASEAHGCHPLAHAQRADWGRIAELAKQAAFADVGLEQCLFLDTETTGLYGGAGNLVFLCGMGFFDRPASEDGTAEFVLEQVFLRSFTEEPAALRAVADRLVARPNLVTFVGKTFDRHRLAARMAVNRIVSPVLTTSHLDLYYLARRRFGRSLPDVKLRTVEQRILRLRRDGDLPGAEAPVAFLSWLRDGSGRVDRVLEHNRLDVLSLVVLLGVLGAADADSASGSPAAAAAAAAVVESPAAAVAVDSPAAILEHVDADHLAADMADAANHAHLVTAAGRIAATAADDAGTSAPQCVPEPPSPSPSPSPPPPPPPHADADAGPAIEHARPAEAAP